MTRRRLPYALSCLILGLITLGACVTGQKTFASRTVYQTTSVVGNGNIVGGTVTVGNINNSGATKSSIDATQPLMQAFDSSVFSFRGQPGAFYNLISEQNGFQVSAQLVQPSGARGTYVQTLGFKQDDVLLRFEVQDDSTSMAVEVNGEPLSADNRQAGLSQVLPLSGGGNVVLIMNADFTTAQVVGPDVKLSISLVQKAVKGSGEVQPAYLDLDVTLMGSPSGALQGALGDTYGYNSRVNVNVQGDSKIVSIGTLNVGSNPAFPVLPEEMYKLSDLFAAPSFTGIGRNQNSPDQQQGTVARVFRAPSTR